MLHVSLFAKKVASAKSAARPRRLRRGRVIPLALMTAGVLAALPAFAGETYRLVPEDRIALRVVEWRSGEGEFKDWTVLNGTFLINDAGAVSIPLVGNVDAAGLSTKDLADRIADLLQQRAGMANKLFTAVEIAQYGPIYVVGGVDKPGQYPFNPDLTVMKAISLAGGFQKDDNIRSRFDRDRIQAAGQFGDAKLDHNGLLMRQARLRAELEGKENFDIPESLAKVSGTEALHVEELNLMKARRVDRESKLAAAKDLDELYTSQIQTLQNKIEAQQRQIALVQKERATVSSLVDKGLSLSSRRFALDRDESDVENKLLDIEFQLSRARQSLEENKRDSAEVVNTMNSEIQTELNTVVREIAKAELQMRVSRLLIDETDQASQKQLLEEQENSENPMKLVIVRRNENGQTQRIEATADTPIKPRDLIEVAPSVGGDELGMAPPQTGDHVAASDIDGRN